MKTRLVVGETFRTKGGLEFEVLSRSGDAFVCLNNPTGWKAYYFGDGRFMYTAAQPDKNLDAEFYVK